MSRAIYNIAVRIYFLIIWFASFFNPKAKKWIQGRRGLFDLIRSKVHINENYIWFHCASVGEFEQGRPLLDTIREQYPQYKIVLTFFSPSGYELRKNFNGVNHVFYLPADTPSNAAEFLKLINPKLAVFVKYEFWLNYLSELKRRNIPSVLISARFLSNQVFFKWYGGIFLNALKFYRSIFVQDEASKNLLSHYQINNVTIANDTRFDRVITIASEAKSLPLVEKFVDDINELFVAGSTWQPDEAIITSHINNNSSGYKFIIVPHEINTGHIKQLQASINKPSLLYSELEQGKEPAGEIVLLIDKVGLLSSVYRYSKIAYVGGGFGKGIHNILEAAVYGRPVIFGPNHLKFIEAIELINCKAAWPVSNESDFKKCFDDLATNETLYRTSSKNAAEYVSSKAGGTQKIFNELKAKGLL